MTIAGRSTFMIIPGQKTIRTLTGKPGGAFAKWIDAGVRKGLAIDTTGAHDYRQWNIPYKGLDLIWRFVEQVPSPSAKAMTELKRHSRLFPGAVRQAALEQFERTGGSVRVSPFRDDRRRPTRSKTSESSSTISCLMPAAARTPP